MKRFLIITICVIMAIALGIAVGIYIYNLNNTVKESFDNNATEININDNTIDAQNVIEIINKKEKTTPNTLLVYRTYFTKCNHYINVYKDIEMNEVNLDREELQEINKGWKVEEFSAEQVILSKEEDEFCGEHYKLKLEDGIVNIYTIDEQGTETEYETTDINEEYLTNEDVLNLKEGILVYGKENLSSTIEDYE